MDKINKQRVYNYYNKKNKWLGLIDYKTITFFVIYLLIVAKLVTFISFLSLIVKIYIISILVMPVLVFIVLNLQEDCIVNKLLIILKFIFSNKLYINKRYYTKCNKIYVKDVEKNHIEKHK